MSEVGTGSVVGRCGAGTNSGADGVDAGSIGGFGVGRGISEPGFGEGAGEGSGVGAGAGGLGAGTGLSLSRSISTILSVDGSFTRSDFSPSFTCHDTVKGISAS